jgi:hypothetical protein
LIKDLHVWLALGLLAYHHHLAGTLVTVLGHSKPSAVSHEVEGTGAEVIHSK